MNIQNRPTAAQLVDVATLENWLVDGREIAFVDVREEGIHGEGHPLLAVDVPFSRLEIDFPKLVPRPATRIVLVAEPAIGPLAAQRLASIGYISVHILDGGAEAWSAAGNTLFASVNVPSKAFAECVEHAYHTPDIEAAELDRLVKSGADIVVLDSRTSEEFERFHVPGAVSAPGAEIVHRFDELVPSPETFVVVSCAGRTRGIIGAQALINAGVPNRVVALSGGTQGWRLAGLELEREVPPAPRLPLSSGSQRAARRRAAALAERFGVPVIDSAALARLRADADRTTYLFDVRTPAEFAAGHAERFVSAQGGQLVQALDKWAGTRGARIVLADDDGVRAIVTAHWLRQLGWDVSVLPGAIADIAPPQAYPLVAVAPEVARLTAEQATVWRESGAALISADSSADYRTSHPEAAIWANRSRFDRLPPDIIESKRIIVTGREFATAHLLAFELAQNIAGEVAVLTGAEEIWRAAGWNVVASPETPRDSERVDYLFWLHDRHSGNPAASRAYLDWELALPGAVGAPETTGFRLP